MSVKRVSGKEAKALSISLKDIEGKELKVGWVSQKYYPDSNMTTAQVAAISEYGSPKNNIPPRPIIRPTIIREQNQWRKVVENESRLILTGKQTATEALNVLGNIASGDMRSTITKITAPPLKKATVAARERTFAGKRVTRKGRKSQIKERLGASSLWKPLVFTKNLLNSLTFSVENK